ncbi:HIT family protein [Nesterenkonia alkaliphila]|uniref:HIT domain-containing protein n=1 Tax=Nesterenkonia alkaliphila TaxID=1463631 RepID=A0A7K1UH70_9MICC|nr:HIT domain-containing protein [Nesterenkonia alkaliphila]MVT25820.1 HIT domain-containing protein [Nesterenkonia alkaliphila]GFZ90904.1 hydrolase [Nesterenkonia alkaliphila]
MTELPGADYQGNDFYCDVAIPNSASLDVVLETEEVLAYHHTKPYWETHIVVVPKMHIPSLTQIGDTDRSTLENFLLAVQQVAHQVENEHGAAGVLSNLGDYQDSKHLHVHVHSGSRRH